ncbi:MAG: serine hydrolase [Acidobacteria bacterium]|nr:serine hydrolase [Acidobacteriota bacterium]MCB9397228.1 serine hydrolase [Acidobacteriota bacterium]
MTHLTLFFLQFLFFSMPGTETDLMAQKIDALMSQYHLNHEFNGSVLVAQNGQVIYEKGFGLANVEWQIPNAPDTRFRLASLTKQFTAMAVLQLVQEGKLKLEDTVSDHLPFYRADTGAKITIHQLLCHTSGIPSYGRDKVFMQKQARNPVEIQQFIRERCSGDLEFVPGSQFK